MSERAGMAVLVTKPAFLTFLVNLVKTELSGLRVGENRGRVADSLGG